MSVPDAASRYRVVIGFPRCGVNTTGEWKTTSSARSSSSAPGDSPATYRCQRATTSPIPSIPTLLVLPAIPRRSLARMPAPGSSVCDPHHSTDRWEADVTATEERTLPGPGGESSEPEHV